MTRAREAVSDAGALPGAIGAFHGGPRGGQRSASLVDTVRAIPLGWETSTPFPLVHMYDALDEPQFILVPEVVLGFTGVNDD